MQNPNDPRYITVYAESTPNPASMKFVASNWLVTNGDAYEFSASSSTLQSSPFAKKLFEFPFVKGLFISANFITITKSEAVEWIEVTGQLREFFQNYLREGNLVVKAEALLNEMKNDDTEHIISPAKEYSETENKIISIIDEYVRPAVEQDGGLITFHSFNDGIVKVTLQGSCSGCPSSQMTLKSGIENLLKQMVPGVQSVEAVEA